MSIFADALCSVLIESTTSEIPISRLNIHSCYIIRRYTAFHCCAPPRRNIFKRLNKQRCLFQCKHRDLLPSQLISVKIRSQSNEEFHVFPRKTQFNRIPRYTDRLNAFGLKYGFKLEKVSEYFIRRREMVSNSSWFFQRRIKKRYSSV